MFTSSLCDWMSVFRTGTYCYWFSQKGDMLILNLRWLCHMSQFVVQGWRSWICYKSIIFFLLTEKQLQFPKISLCFGASKLTDTGQFKMLKNTWLFSSRGTNRLFARSLIYNWQQLIFMNICNICFTLSVKKNGQCFFLFLCRGKIKFPLWDNWLKNKENKQ